MWHLTKRFFGSLLARPLTEPERELVHEMLPPDLSNLFFTMGRADQRHSLSVFLALGSDPELAEAALLHDVGKTASHLGPIARSLATIADLIGVPITGRWRQYRDHGPIGAQMLREAGAGELAVSFAEFHPGPPPADIPVATWQRLSDADQT